MKVALFANITKKESFELGKNIIAFFRDHEVEVVTREDESKNFGIPSLSTVKPEEIDFLISCGGDGTILRLVHHFPHILAPIVGINLGHLGFMADIPLEDLYESLEDLIKKKIIIQNRLMMEGMTTSGEKCFAVNEMVIHRAKNPSLIDLSIHVDGTYLDTFSADGVIIATPSGSTAYSLAAGGPILTPELEAFVITPISPHTISNRPIVILPKENIEVQYLSPYEPVEITYDGISRYNIATNDVFTISRSSRTFKMVSFARRDFFSTLRKKMGWSGRVRYSSLNKEELS
ncbi:MAG: NAD(+)/NADH kinase [Chlamydiia bacterium]|nr:NAD(+)/NADH kinase [Chlamydiia bacterium]